MELEMDEMKAELEAVKKSKENLKSINKGLEKNLAALREKVPPLFNFAVKDGRSNDDIINFLANPKPLEDHLIQVMFGRKSVSKPFFGP
ncbi:hypothetical protein LTR95_008177 [Oleoguttula sp. CCFEE 5521]